MLDIIRKLEILTQNSIGKLEFNLLNYNIKQVNHVIMIEALLSDVLLAFLKVIKLKVS